MEIALIKFSKSGRTKITVWRRFKKVLSFDCNDSITAADHLAFYCQASKLGIKKGQSTLIGVVGIFFLSKRRTDEGNN
jgi:hypothetical protein